MTCKILFLVFPEANKAIIFIPIITEPGCLNLNDAVVFFPKAIKRESKIQKQHRNSPAH